MKNTKTQFSNFLLLLLIIAFSGATKSQVVLNEIMFDPLFSEHSDEFIEILNISDSQSFDLAGWEVHDQDGYDIIIDSGMGTNLKPGQYGLILDPDYFTDSQSYDALIPDSTLIVTIDGSTFGSRGLSNSQNETVTLIDRKGKHITSHTYTTNKESGFSEERINPQRPDLPENWEQSCRVHGTPGYQNSVYADQITDRIMLTIDPNPFSPDHDGIDDTACITYSLPWGSATVSVKVFDPAGRLIKTLQSVDPSGSQNTIYWNGTTKNNTIAPVGIYIIFLEAISEKTGETVNHKKSVVLARKL
ncbi:MAG: lamin tail domain-containing protein [bacterium]